MFSETSPRLSTFFFHFSTFNGALCSILPTELLKLLYPGTVTASFSIYISFSSSDVDCREMKSSAKMCPLDGYRYSAAPILKAAPHPALLEHRLKHLHFRSFSLLGLKNRPLRSFLYIFICYLLDQFWYLKSSVFPIV